MLIIAPVVVVAAESTESSPDLLIQGLSPAEAYHSGKSLTVRLAQTDPELLGRQDGKVVNVIVKLDYDSIATYAGGIEGLAATAPGVTGRHIDKAHPAVQAYEEYVKRTERDITSLIRARIPDARFGQSLRIAYGGIAMQLPANQIQTLLEVDGVVAVQKDSLEKPLTDATPAFLGATTAWDSLGGPHRAGEGVIVGVLDTGIWPEHPSYSDPGIAHPGGIFGCEFGDGTDPLLGPSFACNDKLIGAYAFTDTYLLVLDALPGEFCNNTTGQCSARDADGHGTHTSSTAAGGPVASAQLFGVERGPLSGMAPGAHVIMFRVCLDQGCFQSDSVAAVGQAILDGVDIINFSISGGSSPFTDPVELAFLDAYASGILVSASAGNSGPGPATANHAGPWVITVGASTSNRHFFSTLQLSADGPDTLQIQGVTLMAGIDSPTLVVKAENIAPANPSKPHTKRCLEPLAPGSAAGVIVACERGTNARVAKSFNVLQGGAVGMILYNPTLQGLNSDNHWVSSIHIEAPPTAFLNFLNTHTNVRASWANGTPTPILGDVMTSFSSRGPVGDWVKPDVTAPGIQILAGRTPQPHPANIPAGPPGELYQAIAGTSMSSPHSAGIAALVKAAHPKWTPGQIKSALMTSSLQSVLKENGVTPSTPFDRGAGSIRADRAISPTATFDVPAKDYFDAANDPLGRVHLNLPSVNAPVMPGTIVTSRTVRSVTDLDVVITVVTQAPPGATISVTPGTFDLGAGNQKKLTITISGLKLATGQYFGQITLVPDNPSLNPVVLPVAFFKRHGDVSLQHTCTPPTFPLDGSSSCRVIAQNKAPVEADVAIAVTATSKALEFSDAASSIPVLAASPRLLLWRGSLSAALAPTVDAINPGGLSYISLRGIGASPLTGIGDETLVNFNVPTFKYGTETYTRIATTSNGYSVVGGGTSLDLNFIPQTFPNPARPNNVLAPLWTDLNPAAGGSLFANLVTRLGKQYIVLEWENVSVFSTPSVQHTFQIWVERATTGESIGFAYGPMGAAGDPAGTNAGAENRDGTSGKNISPVPPASGSSFTVVTGPPTPGGAVEITYTVRARQKGVFDVIANLVSSVTPRGSVTQEAVTLTVT